MLAGTAVCWRRAQTQATRGTKAGRGGNGSGRRVLEQSVGEAVEGGLARRASDFLDGRVKKSEFGSHSQRNLEMHFIRF